MSLWKNLIIQNSSISPQLRIFKIKKYKGTSFCTCNNGTLTVEAAVVIPLLTACLLSILFLFSVLRIQMRIEEALIYAGRRTAVESTLVSDETLLWASAKAQLLLELKEDSEIARYVQGKSLGVSLLGSSFQGDRITLHATYRVKFPISLFGIHEITLWSRESFQKWRGDMSSDGEDGTWVYVTPNGKVYHKLESCKALTIHVQSAFYWSMGQIRGKNGQKYDPCTRCVSQVGDYDMVYFTDYGELYHQKINCSHIKRTIEKKQLAQVSDRSPCKLCCGGS